MMIRHGKIFRGSLALALGLAALLVLACFPRSAAAQQKSGSKLKSWPELKAELKKELQGRVEDTRTSIQRLRVARRPKTVLDSCPDDPGLWSAITGFYDFIQGRELDVSYEQGGIQDFFPDRAAYYDFLDTILPAMRERRFERNRLLTYQVHQITIDPDNPETATVTISITSDDIFPFGKLMIFTQKWRRRGITWYPGKVEAKTATYWERIR